jgi:hypothetical protein
MNVASLLTLIINSPTTIEKDSFISQLPPFPWPTIIFMIHVTNIFFNHEWINEVTAISNYFFHSLSLSFLKWTLSTSHTHSEVIHKNMINSLGSFWFTRPSNWSLRCSLLLQRSREPNGDFFIPFLSYNNKLN